MGRFACRQVEWRRIEQSVRLRTTSPELESAIQGLLRTFTLVLGPTRAISAQ